MSQLKTDQFLKIRTTSILNFFPQDAKKGGAGIEDLPAIMSNSIDTTLKHLSNLSIVTADKGELRGVLIVN